MSDQIKQPSSQAISDVPAISADEARKASRRRLLRMGVKATPAVVATLVGRQALACTCTIPSAWGSIAAAIGEKDMHGVNLGDGSISRYSAVIKGYNNNYRKFSSWTLAGADGWTALKSKVTSWPATNILPKADRKAWLQGTKEVNGVKLSAKALLTLLGLPAPMSWGDQGALTVVGSGGRNQAVLIAFLAYKTGGEYSQCLTLSQLQAMGDGTFQTSSDMGPWSDTKIVDYLHLNWMIRTNNT